MAAVKIAPCNRYQTIDVVSAAADSGTIADIALYNGNEDHIIGDMLTTCRFDGAPKVSITGGLLRQWAVWTSPAVRYFAKCRKVRGAHPLPAELLTLDTHVTDANAALFDAASGFKGCIAGIQCVLAQQGLLAGCGTLDPDEALSPGQTHEIDRERRSYPHLLDDVFISEHLDEWLSKGAYTHERKAAGQGCDNNGKLARHRRSG